MGLLLLVLRKMSRWLMVMQRLQVLLWTLQRQIQQQLLHLPQRLKLYPP